MDNATALSGKNSKHLFLTRSILAPLLPGPLSASADI